MKDSRQFPLNIRLTPIARLGRYGKERVFQNTLSIGLHRIRFIETFQKMSDVLFYP
jgi:hypothetical protein